jgi:hypothetical protein
MVNQTRPLITKVSHFNSTLLSARSDIPLPKTISSNASPPTTTQLEFFFCRGQSWYAFIASHSPIAINKSNSPNTAYSAALIVPNITRGMIEYVRKSALYQ